jgi:hypothetical protein
MQFGIAERHTPGKAIYELLAEARDNEMHDRRANRFAFFRPVTIHTEGDRRYSAFSRDISEWDIGLLHSFELPPGEVGIAISSHRGYSVPLRARIIWCRPCGEGWYISGGEFVGISPLALPGKPAAQVPLPDQRTVQE